MSAENTQQCPDCATEMFPQGGALWCPDCEMEYWQDGGWWRCGESGDAERVAATDGGWSDTNRQLTTLSESMEIRRLGGGYSLVVTHDDGETAHIPLDSLELDARAALDEVASAGRFVPQEFAENDWNFVEMEGES